MDQKNTDLKLYLGHPKGYQIKFIFNYRTMYSL